MQAQLKIDVASGPPDRRILVLRGEIDVATARELEAALEQVCSEDVREVVVDLRALAFMDSSGVRMIALGRDLCAIHGREYFLIRPKGGIVQRVLAMSGLDDDPSFPDLPSRELALLGTRLDDPDPAPA